VPVELRAADGSLVGEGRTDADGRVAAIGPDRLQAGDYSLRFDTAAWFAASRTAGFYPEVTVTFTIADAGQHYHVPLLLNPFGYSTYRGS
jgi:5-hydroxyisourate hydrolase